MRTLSQMCPTYSGGFSIFLLNEITKQPVPCSNKQAWTGQLLLHLVVYIEVVDRLRPLPAWPYSTSSDNDVCTHIRQTPYIVHPTAVHNELELGNFLCWSARGLWSTGMDLTCRFLRKLWAWPRSVGNQHSASWPDSGPCKITEAAARGPGYDFPRMDPVQARD